MFSESLFLKSFQFPEKTASLTSLAVFVILIYVTFVFIFNFMVIPVTDWHCIAGFHDEIIVYGLNVIHIHQITLMAAQEPLIRQFFLQIIQFASSYKTAVICCKNMADSCLTFDILNLIVFEPVYLSAELKCKCLVPHL